MQKRWKHNTPSIRQDRQETWLCPPTGDATGKRNQKSKYQRTHNNAPPIYNGPAIHQDKQDIFHTTERGRKKGPETYPNTSKYRSFDAAAAVYSKSNVDTSSTPWSAWDFPTLSSVSFHRFRQPRILTSTAAVVSLSWPLGRDVTDNTPTTSETNTNTAPRKKTKYKLPGKNEKRATKHTNTTNRTSFTRGKTKCVLYSV